MRLIDADALKKEFPKDEDWEYPVNTNEYVCEKIDEQPTIEERKTGRWIKELWHSNHVRLCSACHVTQTVTTYRGIVNFKFCPYFGCDMRGENNG